MDGEEIDRITRDVPPLTDMYPKRLTDEMWDDQENHRFALTYLDALSALQRFTHSALIQRIWPDALDPATAGLESFFNLRESRYLSEMMGSNVSRTRRLSAPFTPANPGTGGAKK